MKRITALVLVIVMVFCMCFAVSAETEAVELSIGDKIEYKDLVIVPYLVEIGKGGNFFYHKGDGSSCGSGVLQAKPWTDIPAPYVILELSVLNCGKEKYECTKNEFMRMISAKLDYDDWSVFDFEMEYAYQNGCGTSSVRSIEIAPKETAYIAIRYVPSDEVYNDTVSSLLIRFKVGGTTYELPLNDRNNEEKTTICDWNASDYYKAVLFFEKDRKQNALEIFQTLPKDYKECSNYISLCKS